MEFKQTRGRGGELFCLGKGTFSDSMIGCNPRGGETGDRKERYGRDHEYGEGGKQGKREQCRQVL